MKERPYTYGVNLREALGWGTPGEYVFDGERYRVTDETFSDGTPKILGTMGGGWYPIFSLSFQERHEGHFGPPDERGRRGFIKDPPGTWPQPGIIFA